jgi:hypothetical protein
MSRQASIDRLPEQIRTELETRIRRDNAKSSALADWLESEGYTIDYHAVNRYVNKIKARAAAVEAQAEAIVATNRIAQVTGMDIQFDLLDAAKIKLMLELQGYEVGTGLLKPAQLFGAIARVTAVDVQIHKFIQELKSKVTAEIHLMEGEPGIDLETLKTIRERVYGIFDAVDE